MCSDQKVFPSFGEVKQQHHQPRVRPCVAIQQENIISILEQLEQVGQFLVFY